MSTVQGLTFEAEPHLYRFRGAIVPSVTEILEPYSGLEFVDPDHLAMLARFGNHVHQAVHLWNIGDLDESTLSDSLVPYLNGWKQYLADTGAEVVESEKQVYHPTAKYAGTLDTILRYARTDTRLIDLKSTTSVPRTVGPQTAAYDEARRSQEGGRKLRRGCVHLTGQDDGIGYKYKDLDDARDFSRFKAALLLHQWQNGD